MFANISKIKDAVFDILFPAVCLNCQRYIGNNYQSICDTCFEKIKLNTSLFCPFCRIRLADNKKICRHSKKDFPFSYFLAAAGNYDDPILRNLIHCFKYQKFEKLASVLEKILLNYFRILNLKSFNLKSVVIIPIPLHFWRERTRGFNQSKLLAEYIAPKLNLEIVDGLKRIKNNKPQAKSKNSEERNKNVEGIFRIANPDLIRGKNIILIDDVFTSGATMNEAVKILKQNGARRIIAFVVAKT